MRKLIFSAILMASSVAVAAPAAAQWAAPAPQGYAYGYNNHGQVRRLEARLMQARNEIRRLDRANILSDREARRLNEDVRQARYRLRQLDNNGLTRRERHELETRISRIERSIQREARDGNDYRGAYGNRDGYSDRDRDGRDDRYEDDRGHDHD